MCDASFLLWLFPFHSVGDEGPCTRRTLFYRAFEPAVRIEPAVWLEPAVWRDLARRSHRRRRAATHPDRLSRPAVLRMHLRERLRHTLADAVDGSSSATRRSGAAREGASTRTPGVSRELGAVSSGGNSFVMSRLVSVCHSYHGGRGRQRQRPAGSHHSGSLDGREG